MANSYEINFTDPLKPAFNLPASGMNGPGSADPQTSLRLYGRGATEWGESVDENFVRLLENFASATEPLFPVSGQLWARRELYHIVGDVTGAAGSVAANIYRFNLRDNVWEQSSAASDATFKVVIIDVTISSYALGAVGEYVYSRVDEKLYRWDSAYKQMPATWLSRAYTEVDAAPIAGTTPNQTLLIYNDASADWSRLTNVVVSPSEPTGNYLGRLWYNPTNGRLYFWNGTSYSQIIGPSSSGNVEIEADLDMQNTYSVINMRDPINAHDGVTLSFVNTYISGQASSLFLPVAGGTMTGTLNFNGTNEITFSNNLVIRSASGTVRVAPSAAGALTNLEVHSSNTLASDNVLAFSSQANVARIESRNSGATTANPLSFAFNGIERLRLTASGAIGFNGANYGTSGSALVSSGSGLAPTWTTFAIGSNSEGTRYISANDPNNTVGNDGDIWYKVL